LSRLVFFSLLFSSFLFYCLLLPSLVFSCLLLSLSFCFGLRLCLCLCCLVLALPLWSLSCHVMSLVSSWKIHIILSTSNSLCYNIQNKNKTRVCVSFGFVLCFRKAWTSPSKSGSPLSTTKVMMAPNPWLTRGFDLVFAFVFVLAFLPVG
jgi:hypothetical protein